MRLHHCWLIRSELDEIAERHDRRRGHAMAERPWCLFGSAVLQLHGLREEISDLDIAVSAQTFEALAGKLMWSLRVPHVSHPPFLVRQVAGSEVHVFYDWRHDEPLINLPEARRKSSVIDGWPATSLQVVRVHKIACRDYHGVEGRWAKHAVDLENLNRHLGLEPA